MKLFKNGIELKYVLLVIGILAVSGIAIATTDPIIGDNINYLDALNITRWIRATQFIDANNTAYYVDPAGTSNLNGVNATAVNSTGNVTFGSGGDQIFFDTTKPKIVFGSSTTAQDIEGIDLSYVNGYILMKQGYGVYWDNGGNHITSYGFNHDTVSIAMNGLVNDAQSNALCWNSGGNNRLSYNSGQTTCVASSEKVKHDITDVNTQEINSKFYKMKPINFIYNNDRYNQTRIGFSAQEACPIYPEICNTDYQGNGTFVRVLTDEKGKGTGVLYSDGKTGNITGISYELYTTILTSKIQEQQSQLDVQSAQIRNICTNNPQLCS